MITNVNYYRNLTTVNVILSLLDLSNKDKYHHNVGYYSDAFVSYSKVPTEVEVEGVPGYHRVNIDYQYVNFSYDKTDLIVQSQPSIEYSGSLALGKRIFTNDSSGGKVMVGAVTNRYVHPVTLRQYYPIGGGKFSNYYHFTRIAEFIIKRKSKLIAYANREFDTKEELVSFLQESPQASPRIAILYHTDIIDTVPSACQLIVSENSRNVVSIHFRKPAINKYDVESDSDILSNFSF